MYPLASVALISAYFPEITPAQKKQFAALQGLYQTWNERINVISKKDIHHLYLHHVLHSLSIAKFFTFAPESQVLDLGTGGGFPGIPLAILFPQAHFTLIDGKLKKIKVVRAVADYIKLSNVHACAMRAEEVRDRYDWEGHFNCVK